MTESFHTTQGLILYMPQGGAIPAPQIWGQQIYDTHSTTHPHQPISTKGPSDKMFLLHHLSTSEYRSTRRWAEQGPEGTALTNTPIVTRIPGRRIPWLQQYSWTSQRSAKQRGHPTPSLPLLEPKAFSGLRCSVVQSGSCFLRMRGLTAIQKRKEGRGFEDVDSKWKKDAVMKTVLPDTWKACRIGWFGENDNWLTINGAIL